MFNINSENGISLLLVVLITSVILSIGLGISVIIIKQIKMMENVGYSVIAFYAADTGIEAALYDLYHSKPPHPKHSNQPKPDYYFDNIILNGAYYNTEAECCHFNVGKCSLTDPENPPENPKPCPFIADYINPDCNALNFCLESAGGYKTIKRAIKIRY